MDKIKLFLIVIMCLMLTRVFAQTATIDSKNNAILIQKDAPAVEKHTIDECERNISAYTKSVTAMQAQLAFWTTTCQQATDAGLKTRQEIIAEEAQAANQEQINQQDTD